MGASKFFIDESFKELAKMMDIALDKKNPESESFLNTLRTLFNRPSMNRTELRKLRDYTYNIGNGDDKSAAGAKSLPDLQKDLASSKDIFSQDKTEAVLSNWVAPIASNAAATLGNIGAILNSGKAAMLTNMAHNVPKSNVYKSVRSQLGDVAAILAAKGAMEKAIGNGVANTVDTITEKTDRAHDKRDAYAFSAANPGASGNVYNVISKNTAKAKPTVSGIDVQE